MITQSHKNLVIKFEDWLIMIKGCYIKENNVYIYKYIYIYIIHIEVPKIINISYVELIGVICNFLKEQNQNT